MRKFRFVIFRNPEGAKVSFTEKLDPHEIERMLSMEGVIGVFIGKE